MAASARVWQVFPFDLSFGGWTALLRVLLAVAVAGGVIGAVVQVVALIRVFDE